VSKVAGKKRDGNALFDEVDGIPYFWKDLADFLDETLKS